MPDYTTEEHSELILAKSNGRLLHDPIKKIAKIRWEGVVDLETAKTIVNKGAFLVESGQADKVLLNREHLTEFTSEARQWINYLVKTRGKRAIKNIHKVATVKPNTTMGHLFSTLVTSSIKLIYPRLSMKQFNTEAEAQEWLLL